MSENQEERRTSRSPYGFSLAELIVGLTAFAALFGIWQTAAIPGDIEPALVAAATVFGILGGIVVGAVSGSSFGRWFVTLGVLFGGIAGGIAGAATGIRVSLPAVALGCAVVCATALGCNRLARWFS